MKISGKRRNEIQRHFIQPDRKIDTLGRARTFVGDIVEDFAAEMLNADRLKTDSTVDICPDLQRGPKDFLEVKASGSSNQIILYVERCDRYDDFMSEGNTLSYWVYCHSLKLQSVKWESDLRNELLRRFTKSIEVPMKSVHDYVKDREPRIVNGAAGNPKYKMGWTVSTNVLKCLPGAFVKFNKP